MNIELENIISKVDEKISKIGEEINCILIDKDLSNCDLFVEIADEEDYIKYALEHNGEIYCLKATEYDSEWGEYLVDLDINSLSVQELRVLASEELNVRIIEKRPHPQNLKSIASFSFGE